jgi:hypothetical protein
LTFLSLKIVIKQWGYFNSGRQSYPTDSSTFGFPITFPNSCYQTILSANDGGTYTASWTNSTLTIHVKNYKAGLKDNVYINTVRYWAVGK